MKDEPNPYRAPKSQETPPQPTLRSRVPASAGNLELQRKLREPPVCLKCGATDKIERREETFQWSVRRGKSGAFWFAIFGIFGMLLARFVHVDNDRAATLHLPLCKTCNSRWTIAKVLSTGAWGAAFVAFLMARRPDHGVAPYFVLFAALVAAAIAMSFELKRRSLRPLYIDDEIVVLEGGTPLSVERLAEARAAEKVKAAKKKKGKTKRRPLLREPDAAVDRMGYEASSDNTRSLDSVASDERDAGR